MLLAMVGWSALIDHQLAAFEWREAKEQTQNNQQLHLEGQYRVFLPNFQQGKAWLAALGQYNPLDPLLWNNEQTLILLQQEQLQQELNFQEQYQAQKAQLEEQYWQAKVNYLNENLVYTADTATYENLKKSQLLQFEAQQGEALLKKQAILEQEMEAFNQHYQTTLTALSN